MMVSRVRAACLALACLFTLIGHTLAQNDTEADTWITYNNNEGEVVYLRDNRRPSLYTGNFGDCLGGSAINITRFDAAFYHDNMTVLFHLAGNSQLYNQSLMMYIGVFAYGESRFDLTFNPCAANIESLCPINSSVPIVASGIIPVDQNDISGVPSIAYSIPDFEGEAILRIFANATEQEVGCYSAVLTNGQSFSQPASVGTILGIFTLVAVLASFATAIYGEAVSTMRLHYAHSLSVGVVFAVWQHIFYTGALSVNWPSVLVAWWSNFAWAGGMIYSSSMQNSINRLLGENVGNTTAVGAAASGSTQETLGGGYDISQIYGRALTALSKRAVTGLPAHHPVVRDVAAEIYGRDYSKVLKRDLLSRAAEHALLRRDGALANRSSGYDWYGHPVGPGLPLPGNFSGFAGTLGQEGIRASNAFMTGFLWFLILFVLLVAATVAFKWILEGLARFKLIQPDRLRYFRDHWLGYTALVALRTLFIAFFMMMFLTIFQFTYDSPGGVTAIAAVVFVIFFIGLSGAAAYAVWYKHNVDVRADDKTGRTQVESKSLLRKFPWVGSRKTEGTPAHDETRSQITVDQDTKEKPSLWRRVSSMGNVTKSESGIESIHDNDDYTVKFGWLASRFRRTRWWFFAAWLPYEFIRACFYGGASGHALTQVFALLIVEIVAFALVIWAKPFEGRRLNVLVVYMLGFSKVTSVALSAAFDVQFNVPRIITTVIGVIIIVIQGILTITVMISIVVGAISSYMSVSRNREDFRPRRWAQYREKYFDHLDRVVNDLPREKKPSAPKMPPMPLAPVEPHFEMKGVRRLAKIEDEDADFTAEMSEPSHTAAHSATGLLDTAGNSRVRSSSMYSAQNASRSKVFSQPASMRSSRSVSSLPYGARAHRPSWSTRDFQEHLGDDAGQRRGSFTPIDMQREVSDDGVTAASASHPVSHTDKPPTYTRSLSVPKPYSSTENVHVGSDVSTRDSIGVVPVPSARPRSGTHGSLQRSRSNTSSLADMGGSRNSDIVVSPVDMHNDGRRHVRYPLLTPAQETEEWSAK